MALIMQGVSTCAICGEKLDEDRDFMATSGVWYDREDPLWEFCDAGIHWDCYLSWPHRARFAEDYARSRSQGVEDNPYWGNIYSDDHLYLTVSRHSAMAWVRATGTAITFPAVAWPLTEGPLHPLEREALERSGLAQKFPTFEELVARVDWDAKFRLAEKMAREVEARKIRLMQECGQINQVAEEWAQKLQADGLECPNCHRTSKNIRYYDKRPDRVSYFLCQECGKSFQP